MRYLLRCLLCAACSVLAGEGKDAAPIKGCTEKVFDAP